MIPGSALSLPVTDTDTCISPCVSGEEAARIPHKTSVRRTFQEETAHKTRDD